MPNKKISELSNNTVYKNDDVVLINDQNITKKTSLFSLKNNLFTQFPTATATRSNMGATLTGTIKWAGGVLAPNGKIYGIPFNSTDILIIDPVAGTATRSNMGATLTGTNKWAGGVLAPNGKIYGIPNYSSNILIIDPVAGTATRSNMGASLPDTNTWAGGVLAPNGKIYGMPIETTNILQITPELNTSAVNIPIERCISAYYNKF